MSKKTQHPNRIPFAGILTHVDVASDASPSGARGHRVILTKRAAQAALPTLIGMAIDFHTLWDTHDSQRKCGVISKAWFEDSELHVSGYVYGRDFPEVTKKLADPEAKLGMSYELCDAHVEDMRAEVWTLTKVTFTGAAILIARKAAYRKTRVALSASAETFGGVLKFVSATGSVRIGGKR